MKFYTCEHCGNIIEYVKESGVPVMCCGNNLTELIPGTSDGALEKHVPVVTIDKDKITVEVGAVEHPMIEAHYIQWIVIETTRGSQKVKLDYTDKPRAEFKLADGEKFVAAYEYCNIHGLYSTDSISEKMAEMPSFFVQNLGLGLNMDRGLRFPPLFNKT